MRGKSEDYDQVKKPYSVGITKKAIKGLQLISKRKNISVSEFVERIGREILTLNDDQSGQ